MPCCQQPPPDGVDAPARGLCAPIVLGTVALPLLLLAGCCRAPGETPMNASTTPRKPQARQITVELLALDLSTCGRCTRTESNLDVAVRDVAAMLHAEVDVRKTVIRTAADAVRHRFASSPTIRLDGRDIALDFRESECADCGELCGCQGGVACRLWLWKGREHLEAPREMIVDALLRADREPAMATSPPSTPFVFPENLARYFAHRAAAEAGSSACCAGSDCCEPHEREACCGTVSPGGTCDCRE